MSPSKVENASSAEWITIAQAIKLMPVPVSKSTVRRWVDEDKHGIVAGRFGSRVVIRADSLPRVIEDYPEEDF